MNRWAASWPEAISSLFRNSRSTLLCASAIVLAVAAYSAVTSIAEGMTQVLGRRFETLGNDTLVVRGRSAVDGFVPNLVDMAEFKRLNRQVDRVALVQELSGVSTLLEGPDTREVAQVLAVSDDYFAIDRVALGAGQMFGTRASIGKRCLLGAQIAKKLYGGAPAVGRFLRIGGQWYTVAGVLTETDEPGKFVSNDHVVFIPLISATALTRPGDDGGRLIVKATSGTDIDSLRDLIMTDLLRRHGHRYNADDFRIESKQDLLIGAKAVTQSQGRTVSLISLLATLVAALGVMNMMFLSVDERRSEIGLRRAVGASKLDIVLMFVSEALALCFFCIPIGILIGGGAAGLMQRVFSLEAAPVLGFGASAVVALTTTLVVVVFSLAPAWQAARVDPKSVLRSE